MKKLLLFPLILILLFFNGCDKNRIYEKNKKIKDYVWYYDNILPFEVEITDTGSVYNLQVNIRHAGLYAFRNLWVIIHTSFPSGKKLEQRIEIPLADNQGKWFGNGLGDIWDYSSTIQKNAFFTETGIYTFEIEQNMRQNPLIGIMEMGIRIERTGKKKEMIRQGGERK